MNTWLFIFVDSLIIAMIIEGVKKISVFKKTWKFDWLRSVCIMLIALAVSFAITYLLGIGFNVFATVLEAISYSVLAWFIQKAMGEEVIHKIVKQITAKMAGV